MKRVFKLFNFFENLGLQYKFILITTIAIIVLMSIIGYLAVERERTLLYSEVERQGRLLAETLAIPIINDLIYERLGLVEEGGLIDNYVMETYNRQDIDLVYIAILNEEGKVISHNDLTEYGKIYNDSLTQKLLTANTTLIEQSSNTPINHKVLDVGTPLSIGKKRWGTLRFAVSLKKVEEEIMSTITKIILFTIILLIIGFVIILLLSRQFIRPITQLANTMEQARGDYLDVKVDVKGRDELALLGEKFNTMIERIKEANEEIRKAQEKLVQSEKLASVGILAAGVAHEINNPLGGLFNCVHLLESRGEEKEFRREYLKLIKEGLEKIENTVGKLLWVSKTGEDKISLTNVEDVIKNVVFLVEYRLNKNNIRLRLLNESDTNLIMIDSIDLQQVMLNLFINAIQAMPSGGDLTVKTSAVDSKVVIEITDTGCGISEENLGRIFDPFFTTKAPGEGTGLGLWMSYEIIRKYNGEISVRSRLGEGSTFTLFFPATHEEFA